MEKYKVVVDDRELFVDADSTLEELAEKFESDEGNRIILAEVDGKLSELCRRVEDGTKIVFKHFRKIENSLYNDING